MGVPSFFRWLAEKCPMIVQPYDENSFPGIDNLYLDMNGIIHKCINPGDSDLLLKKNDFMSSIFEYVDLIFEMVSPSLIFMAVDGVAPRAKMNQQRQRRYRSSFERKKKFDAMVEKGESKPHNLEDFFDRNAITPGTEFMQRLDDGFQEFIRRKLESDEKWKNCKIIYSGHNVPGEGEHKIMDFIRTRKKTNDLSPTETHCLYGLDADLIMLGLSTHEAYFTLLREDVFGRFGREKNVKLLMNEFQMVYLSVLRDYLDVIFQEGVKYEKYEYSIERVIDDFILICFLCGNDFLPHNPTLDIRHGAIDELISYYKKTVPLLDDYLTTGSGEIHFGNLQLFLKGLRPLEEKILRLKLEEEKGRSKMKKEEECEGEGEGDDQQVVFKEWRYNYYKNKLGIEVTDDDDQREQQQTEEKEKYYSLCKSYMEGIQWNFAYYFKGLVSWKWYYPYHYSPLSSDLINNNNFEKIQFELGGPFTPFQQLLGVIPPFSSSLLPKVYSDLFHSQDSEMKEYFPKSEDEITIDREGTTQDWQAVYIVPFIDEDVLLKVDQERVEMNQLNPDEVRRNKNGKELRFFTNEKKGGEEEEEEEGPAATIPSIPASKDGRTVLPGSQGSLISFPSLRFKSIQGYSKKIGVRIFRHRSRKETTVIRICEEKSRNLPFQKYENKEFYFPSATTIAEKKSSEEPEKEGGESKEVILKRREQEIQKAIGRKVLICYPIPVQGIVTCIATVDKTYKKDRTISHSEEEKASFLTESNYHKMKLLERYGLDIYPLEADHTQQQQQQQQQDVLVYVKLMEGMKKNVFNDRVIRDRSQSDYVIPLELVKFSLFQPNDDNNTNNLQNLYVEDPKFEERKSKKDLKEGSFVVSLKADKNIYGNVGKIVGVHEHNETYEVHFPIRKPLLYQQQKHHHHHHQKKKKKKNVNQNGSNAVLDEYALMEDIEEIEEEGKKWFLLDRIDEKLKEMGITYKALAKILGFLPVKITTKEEEAKKNKTKTFSIGLNLKSSTTKVNGYTKCMIDKKFSNRSYYLNFYTSHYDHTNSSFSTIPKPPRWYLSQTTIQLIDDYKKKFPLLFENLEKKLLEYDQQKQQQQQQQYIRFEVGWKDLFPDSKDEGVSEILEIESWMGQQEEYQKSEILPIEQKTMTAQELSRISQEMQIFTLVEDRRHQPHAFQQLALAQQQHPHAHAQERCVFNFDTSVLLHDPFSLDPLPLTSKFCEHLDIGHEVVYVSSTGCSTLGKRGIVISIQDDYVQLLHREEIQEDQMTKRYFLKKSIVRRSQNLIDLTRWSYKFKTGIGVLKKIEFPFKVYMKIIMPDHHHQQQHHQLNNNMNQNNNNINKAGLGREDIMKYFEEDQGIRIKLLEPHYVDFFDRGFAFITFWEKEDADKVISRGLVIGHDINGYPFILRKIFPKRGGNTGGGGGHRGGGGGNMMMGGGGHQRYNNRGYNHHHHHHQQHHHQHHHQQRNNYSNRHQYQHQYQYQQQQHHPPQQPPSPQQQQQPPSPSSQHPQRRYYTTPGYRSYQPYNPPPPPQQQHHHHQQHQHHQHHHQQQHNRRYAPHMMYQHHQQQQQQQQHHQQQQQNMLPPSPQHHQQHQQHQQQQHSPTQQQMMYYNDMYSQQQYQQLAHAQQLQQQQQQQQQQPHIPAQQSGTPTSSSSSSPPHDNAGMYYNNEGNNMNYMPRQQQQQQQQPQHLHHQYTVIPPQHHPQQQQQHHGYRGQHVIANNASPLVNPFVGTNENDGVDPSIPQTSSTEVSEEKKE